MSWIETIDYAHAGPELKRIYDRIKGPDNYIDNVLLIHSLRPHTLVGHMTLYKNVLHNTNNTLPKRYLEAIGVYVSALNKCQYCIDHHYAGFRRLNGDDIQSENFRRCAIEDNISEFFSGKELAGCAYAKKITLHHHDITEHDIKILRNTGFSDGEILEINQVACYFNYVNRMVDGLGVNTDGDSLGLSPGKSDDPNSWAHE